jgi:hypothetical protein
MVDWDQVERLRSKGWDWSRIAEDDRAEFTPEASGGDAGRQLKTLYYQRRSKAQRRGPDSEAGEASGDRDPNKPAPLLRFGYAVVPLVGIWAVLAYAFPSLVGYYVPWVYLLIALVVVAALLIYALFRAPVRWDTTLRMPVVIGVAFGLAIAGGAGLFALEQGCPNLSSAANGTMPASWAKYDANANWTQNGVPVFFFYGSIACPYCSASSWAMTLALEQFGTLSGQIYYHSNPNDVYPDTPEVDLAGASYVSKYVSLDVYEGTDDNQISTPALPSCQYQDFVNTYSGGSIPFVVIDGKYVHGGSSLVNPEDLEQNGGTAMTPSQVQGQIDNESGPAWDAIYPAAYAMMAILYVVSGNQPAALLTDYPSVSTDIAQVQAA